VKNDWLTTSSFERAFGIVSAINILSIHAKLKFANATDPTDIEQIKTAQLTLSKFLEKLSSLIESSQKDQSGIILGTDPRFSELALHYMSEQHRLPPRSVLFKFSIKQLDDLVRSQKMEDMPTLIECLTSLRSMIEQYTQTDIAGMFGDE
jgi:hypothetical protein